MIFNIGDSVLFHEVNPGSPDQTQPRAAFITDVYGSTNDPQYAIVYFVQELVYKEGVRPSDEPQGDRFTARPTSEVVPSEPFTEKLFVGKTVHYRSYGTPNAEFIPESRATTVAAIKDNGVIDGVVINPTGTYYNQNLPFAEEPTPGHWNFIREEDVVEFDRPNG